jgi:hypothetical protein
MSKMVVQLLKLGENEVCCNPQNMPCMGAESDAPASSNLNSRLPDVVSDISIFKL